MTLFFLEGGVQQKGIFNIGYGSVRSWKDLAMAAFAALGKEPVIEYIEMPESLRPRYQYYTCLDISKIRQAGFTRELITLEDAAADYAEYFLRKGYLEN